MADFQYLGDVIGESGGCVDATSARITTAWKSFRQLLPIITNRGISLKNWGNICSSCIRACCMVAKNCQNPAEQYVV